jgi:hypothetical protein
MSAHSPFGTLCINIQARRLHVGRPRVCWNSEIAKPPYDNRAPTRRWLSPAVVRTVAFIGRGEQIGTFCATRLLLDQACQDGWRA